MRAKQRTVPLAPPDTPRAGALAQLLRIGVPGALAGFACIAGAQDAATDGQAAVALNPVVVTGSPVATESFELPYSVDSVDMRASQAGNLGVNASEALAGVPGLVIQNRQNYAQDLQISIRGFGARAAFGVRGVKLIADGIPASNPDGQGQAATFNLDTAERIEVLRGPIATVYGNHSGGVIQLFSRDGAGDPQLRGGAIAGAWGTRKYSLGAEGETGGVGYLVNGSRFPPTATAITAPPPATRLSPNSISNPTPTASSPWWPAPCASATPKTL